MQESVNFLNEITAKVDTDGTKDVYVLALMETAHFKLQLNEYDEVKKAIDESSKILDQFDSVETVIYASFYRVSAEYYKVKAEYAQYYKSALLYLACVNNDDLSDKEKAERAYDLAISALLGEMIYNFGELVSNNFYEIAFVNEGWLHGSLENCSWCTLFSIRWAAQNTAGFARSCSHSTVEISANMRPSLLTLANR